MDAFLAGSATVKLELQRAGSLPIEVSPFGNANPVDFFLAGSSPVALVTNGVTGIEPWLLDSALPVMAVPSNAVAASRYLVLTPGPESSVVRSLNPLGSSLVLFKEEGGTSELWSVDTLTGGRTLLVPSLRTPAP